MKSLRGPIVLSFLFLALFAVGAWMAYMDTLPDEKEATKISVIAFSGNNNDRWQSLEQGIRQACGDLGIERPVLSMVQDSGSLQFADVLQREIDSGSKGLLIAAGDETIQSALSRLPDSFPVFLLESAGDDSLPCISANAESMGRALADHLFSERQSGQHVTVLKIHTDRSSIAQRYEAFLSRMEELGQPVTDEIVYENNQEDLRTFLASTIANHKPRIDTLVILDNESLEAAINAIPAAMTDTKLCGIGGSDKVVHALDTGSINALVYQNEYSIGYIGTMALTAELGLTVPPFPSDIQYRLVTKDIMYEAELEQLLFPIIQ